ncbi:MAG: ClpXP protease specificity-enhancing factor SspB [Pseudomonadota bacterium]|nr:ClpXP protease specificity-enhancing factor SspB [Pseudomonadota bacterium]
MPEDLMRYDLLAQNALRGVVRDALRHVQKSGLPGEHHFFIQFDTRYPGVSIGERLSAKYPREMTIVLQHQFYNLLIFEDRFQVELSFDNIQEKLLVPFAAVKGFLDPYVQFGLQFEVKMDEEAAAVTEANAKPAKTKSKVPKIEPAEAKPSDDKPAIVADAEGVATDGAEDNKPKVVSLDSFRKK